MKPEGIRMGCLTLVPRSSRVESVFVNEKEQEQPSLTYKMDLETGEIYGWCEGKEAVKQDIYITLNTDRYEYVIYSDNHGHELKKTFGMKIPAVYPHIERYITEALTQRPLINSVSGFSFSSPKMNVVSCTFTVHSKFGDFTAEKVIKL